MKLESNPSVCSVPGMKRERVKFAKNANALGKKKKRMMMSLVVVEMISYLIIVWFAISLSHLVL